jgi:hypothetical protein
LATINDCDYITSWNFKHLVNVKTVDKIQAVNKLLGYREIKIVPLIEKTKREAALGWARLTELKRKRK